MYILLGTFKLVRVLSIRIKEETPERAAPFLTSFVLKLSFSLTTNVKTKNCFEISMKSLQGRITLRERKFWSLTYPRYDMSLDMSPCIHFS